MISKNTINCILCKNKTEFLDNYKLNVKSDYKYFSKLKIYYCKKCNFSFCSPMPSDKKINYFYKNIYREQGRPHEISSNINDYLYNNVNLNYVQYLSTFIDFNKINTLLDFGSGTGDIGYLLKKKFNHLKLFSIENDTNCQSILNKRSYTNYKSLKKINKKFDIIIATHCLEHLTNLKIFNFFKKISHNKTFLFIEVPNNIFNKTFFDRPYDSPHLLFFSKKTFLQIKKKFNLNLINLSYSSYSISKAFEYMKNFKKKFENFDINKKNLRYNLIKIFKRFLPKKLFSFKDFIISRNHDKLDYFILNQKESWCVRALFKLER